MAPYDEKWLQMDGADQETDGKAEQERVDLNRGIKEPPRFSGVYTEGFDEQPKSSDAQGDAANPAEQEHEGSGDSEYHAAVQDKAHQNNSPYQVFLKPEDRAAYINHCTQASPEQTDPRSASQGQTYPVDAQQGNRMAQGYTPQSASQAGGPEATPQGAIPGAGQPAAAAYAPAYVPGYAPAMPQVNPSVGTHPQPLFYRPQYNPRLESAKYDTNRMMLLCAAMTLFSLVFELLIVLPLYYSGAANIYSLDEKLLYWMQAALVPLSTLLPGVIYLMRTKPRLDTVFRFEHHSAKFTIFGIGAGLGVALLGNFPSFLVRWLLEQIGYQDSSFIPTEFHPESWMFILATAVLAPIMEEFVFRGIMISVLEKYGKGFAVVVSALIFGIAHRSLVSLPFALIAGLVLGFLYVKTRNLWIPILVHFLNNGLSMLQTYSFVYLDEQGQNIFNFLTLVGPIVIGALCLIFLLIFHRKAFFRLYDRDQNGAIIYADTPLLLQKGERKSAVLRSAGFWVIVSVMFLMTLAGMAASYLG